MKTINTFIGVIIMTLVSSGCSMFGIRSEETPVYEVVASEGDKEIRQYASHIVAKTVVKGSFKEGQSEGFRRLAGYIFGKNQSKQKIAMTAPVTVESEKIAMTAPVTQEQSPDGWEMTFMMPSEYTMDDLPIPEDDRVTFEVVPERHVAAIRYSWGRGEKRNAKKGTELTEWVAKQDSYVATSKPISAGYDPPWTLPFFRRNEMLIELDPR